MAVYTAKYINQEFQLADGDELILDYSYPVRMQVAAVSTSVTMATKVITGGTYRDMSPVVATTGVLISSDIWPPKSTYRFSGGASEVKIYGV